MGTLLRWTYETHVEAIGERALKLLHMCVILPNSTVPTSVGVAEENGGWTQTIPNTDVDTTLYTNEDREKFRDIIRMKVMPALVANAPLTTRAISTNLIISHVESRRTLMSSVVEEMFNQCSSVPLTLETWNMMQSVWPTALRYGCRSGEYMRAYAHGVRACAGADTQLTGSISRHCQSELLSTLARLIGADNHAMYTRLNQLQPMTAYALDTDPCLVCHANPDVFKMFALADVSADSRTSTRAQYIKLNDRYEVASVTLRVQHLSKTKSIKHVSVAYTAKTLTTQTLKNSEDVWLHAGSASVQMNQTYVDIDLKIPVVAAGLRITYDAFYERQHAPLLMTCARCPHMPPTTANQCSSCSESLLQCDKCRNINYDERQPFLCKMCGYSKFAKLDVHIAARKTHLIEMSDQRPDTLEMAVSEHTHTLKEADASRARLAKHILQLEGNFTFAPQTPVVAASGVDISSTSLLPISSNHRFAADAVMVGGIEFICVVFI
jgi:E3 ubiquitin-protein ligase UBR4